MQMWTFASKKLAEHAKTTTEKTYFIVQQVASLPETGTLRSPKEAIRELYLAKRIEELTAVVDNIERVMVKYEADATGHPTVKGTEEIIHRLHELDITPTPLIWNPDRIVTDKPYSKIQSVYRYGCNGCGKFGTQLNREQFSCPLLCDGCFGAMPVEHNEQLQAIEERIGVVHDMDTS